MLEAAQVQAMARLARIHLEAAEVPAMADQLARILTLIEQMNSIDTTGVEPLAHPLEPTPRRRTDVVTEVDQRSTFQANAPEAQDGYYLVPRVIE
jgi:aspartyl-tRNA(Asn)/glutamyl-tRNA(Gln) amidotransferase subunit C